MNLVHTMDIAEAVEYSEDARYFTFTYAPWKTLTGNKKPTTYA